VPSTLPAPPKSRICGWGENIVKDQAYTNRFVDVHEKVKAFKDRVRQANKSDAELREDKLTQEAKEMLAKDYGSRH
jgi:hypothetical protein